MTEEEKELVKVSYENGMLPEEIAEEFELNEFEVIELCEEILYNN